MITALNKTKHAQPSKESLAPVITGLLLALVSPVLLILVSAKIKLGFLGGELFFWIIAGLILTIVLLWEKRPLSSIGFRKFTLKDAAHAAVMTVVILLSFPVVYSVLALLEVPIATDMIQAIGSLPVPVLVLLALRAGVTEEILYRGFPIERLLPFTHSRFIAAIVPLLIFIVSHLSWGVAHLSYVVVAGTLLTLFYLWKRNLWLNIISHFVVDILLFLLLPYWF